MSSLIQIRFSTRASSEATRAGRSPIRGLTSSTRALTLGVMSAGSGLPRAHVSRTSWTLVPRRWLAVDSGRGRPEHFSSHHLRWHRSKTLNWLGLTCFRSIAIKAPARKLRRKVRDIQPPHVIPPVQPPAQAGTGLHVARLDRRRLHAQGAGQQVRVFLVESVNVRFCRTRAEPTRRLPGLGQPCGCDGLDALVSAHVPVKKWRPPRPEGGLGALCKHTRGPAGLVGVVPYPALDGATCGVLCHDGRV